MFIYVDFLVVIDTYTMVFIVALSTHIMDKFDALSTAKWIS